jgi:hypothetical protein
VIQRCAAIVNAKAGSSKLEGEWMGSFPLSFELRADLALADGLMLVFHHPVQAD